jgi:hypothetical protein
MKRKIKAFPIILFLSAFILFVSCEKQKPGWKGTIEEENGVTIIKNPKEPIYKEGVFSLEEELSIGESEGREEYMFSQIRDIAVDNEERIYILDVKEGHLKVFDRKGVYIKTIGKKGQGPGELEYPLSVFITGQNGIMINDIRNRRLAFFSKGGRFHKESLSCKGGDNDAQH